MSIVGGHYRHGLRSLTPREINDDDRTASPLELLYDLTFVAAFGVAANQLAHGVATGQWAGATVAFIISMVAVVWAWINFTWFASAFDNDDWLFRVLTMVQMVGVLILAVGLPDISSSIEQHTVLDNGVMVAGYIVMRVAVILQWIRLAHDQRRYRTPALTYALFTGAAQLGWFWLAVLHLRIGLALALIVVLFALEALGPLLAGVNGAVRAGRGTPWHPQHIAERHILLTIIALGETVFGTLSSATTISTVEGWTADAVVAVVAGVALSFALWWLYLLVPHTQMLQLHRDRAIRWGYGHILLYLAIAATGAGMHVLGEAYVPDDPVPAAAAILAVAVPVTLFMATLSALNAWLLPIANVGTTFQIAVLLLPVTAALTTNLGWPLWSGILLVLACPVAVIIAYEVGGWRLLDRRLTIALDLPGSGDVG